MRKVITSEQQHKKMLTEPIPKLVTKVALPTIVSSLITVVYNTADTYFVSQINKSASAAVGVVFSIMAVNQALGFGLGMGAGSLISRKLGEKDNEAAERYAVSAVFAAAIAGLLLCVLGLSFLPKLLLLLGCSDTTLPYAIPYARYILLATPLSCPMFVLNAVLRSEGMSNLSMLGIGSGGIINIGLDWYFITRLHMATGGASLATGISQIVSFLILLFMFLSRRSIVQLHVKKISRSLHDYWMIITTGLPTIFRQGLASIAATALNRQANFFGQDAAVSAVTISNKVYMILRYGVLGFGQGFQPVAGYNYGAGNKKRTWQAFLFAVLCGSVICAIGAVGVSLFGKEIMLWFTNDAEVAMLGQRGLRYVSTVVIFLAFSTYVNMLHQSLGYKFSATFLASCRQGIFFLPAVFLLPLFMGVDGVLAAQPVADFCTFITSIPFLIVFYIKHLRVKKDTL